MILVAIPKIGKRNPVSNLGLSPNYNTNFVVCWACPERSRRVSWVTQPTVATYYSTTHLG